MTLTPCARLRTRPLTWLHFGAGNLCRAFPAVLAQRLLTAGLTDTGIICCDGYDEELIDRCYRACDHLSLSVTLYSNGTINKEIVASVTESLKLSEDGARLKEVFTAPSLQMVTFTITEKGYAIQNDAHDFLPDYKADMESGGGRLPFVLRQARVPVPLARPRRPRSARARVSRQLLG